MLGTREQAYDVPGPPHSRSDHPYGKRPSQQQTSWTLRSIKIRMLPIRRSRGSLPSSPIPGADDLANLTLVEVRDRLARNARVLSSSLFSPSTSPSSTSVLQMQAQAGPSRDPVRERLVQTREALLAREAELLAQGFEGMTVKQEQEQSGSPVSLKGTYMDTRRGSGGMTAQGGRGSGKQRALETIRQGEAGLPSNAIQL